MTSKFLRRTLRNVIFPRRPYFAHLALTHRCNLRCKFCHVTETHFKELDTGTFKKLIDTLDRIGLAVISISGGGEPLLREDFDELINHAALRGLYVKITSNGTMPQARYERLLRSRVDEIGISLDGVRGHDLPFSHVGAPILRTLQFLNDHLPAGKKLTINVTVSQDNAGQVQEIVDYCALHYPRARVWLNPVVVGEGALRTSAPAKTRPDYLRECRSPTLLAAGFYSDAVDAQFRQDCFQWPCLAGDQFFDVKPNGDFWLCQDQPSPVRLNVLEPDFATKRDCLNKEVRRECSGCTYSCYYLVQRGLEPRNWKDMALLWWSANTEPGSAQRRFADRFGFAGGLFSLLLPRLALRMAALGLLALLFAIPVVLRAQPTGIETTPASVLDHMEERSDQQRAALPEWRNIRLYSAGNSRLGQWAKAKVEFATSAHGEKRYRILEQSGSRWILKHVIRPVLEAESASGLPANLPLTEINRRNYEFRFLGFEQQENAYVFAAVPVMNHRYQFRGRVWIDGNSFAVRRVQGSPAVSPSYWVKSTEFTREYSQHGAFWMPANHRSTAELRLVGNSILEIDYGQYYWTAAAR
jgi:MoaA/NifB/PqqE/SkfB family radical SAM enzyme